MWGQDEEAPRGPEDYRGEVEDLLRDTRRRKWWEKGQESLLHLKETGVDLGI